MSTIKIRDVPLHHDFSGGDRTMLPFVTLWQKWCKAFSQKVVSLPRSNHVREIDLITNTMLEALYVTDIDGNITR